MNESTKQLIWTLIGIILLTSVVFVGCYEVSTLKYQNFQNTIKDLDNEQKCLHICGFEFHNYFDDYKMCIEKCDRISERSMKN